MKLVVVVLSEDSRLSSASGLVENSIKATIISSQGLARALEDAEDYSFLGSIKAFLDPSSISLSFPLYKIIRLNWSQSHKTDCWRPESMIWV